MRKHEFRQIDPVGGLPTEACILDVDQIMAATRVKTKTGAPAIQVFFPHGLSVLVVYSQLSWAKVLGHENIQSVARETVGGLPVAYQESGEIPTSRPQIIS